MRLKFVMLLSVCLLGLVGVQQVALAQEAAPARTIPFQSVGFGAKLSPDGKTLVTFENITLRGLKDFDPMLLPMHVLDISTGKERGQLGGYSDYVGDVAFTSDGSRMVSIHMNGDVYIWDMATLKAASSFQTPVMLTSQVNMLADNKHVLMLASGLPQRILMLDTETGAITRSYGKHFNSSLDFRNNYTQFPGLGDIQFAAYEVSPDGQYLAAATVNDELQLWTVADGQYTVIREKSAKFGLFSIRQMAFTPDSKALVYYDASDKQTHVWNIAAKINQAAAIGSDTFALSPDGTRLVWASRSAHAVSIAPLDAPDKAAVLLTLPDGLDVAPRVTWLTFTPDGQQVVAGGFFARDESANQIYVLNTPT